MAQFSSKVSKLLAFGGLAIGTSLISWKLSRINQVLGTELLDASQALFLEQEKQLLRQETQQNFMGYLKLKVGLKMELLEERLAVYYNRLLYFSDYQEINAALIRELVNPMLMNYEKEQVFQNAKVVQFLQNQVTSLLVSIQQKNVKIKQQKQGYIQDLIDIQNKLMTIRFLGLSESQRQAIDLLYNYLNAKDQSLLLLAQDSPAKMQEQPVSINKQDYLSKIQLL